MLSTVQLLERTGNFFAYETPSDMLGRSMVLPRGWEEVVESLTDWKIGQAKQHHRKGTDIT